MGIQSSLEKTAFYRNLHDGENGIEFRGNIRFLTFIFKFGNGREIKLTRKRKTDQAVGFENRAISDSHFGFNRIRHISIQHFLINHGVNQLFQRAVFGKNAENAENGSQNHTEDQSADHGTDTEACKSFAETNKERLIIFLLFLMRLLFLFGFREGFLKHYLTQRLLNATENDPGNKVEKEENQDKCRNANRKCGSDKNCFLQKRSRFEEINHHLFLLDHTKNQLAERLTLDQKLICHQIGNPTGSKKRKYHSDDKRDQSNHGFIHTANQSDNRTDRYKEEKCAK